MTESNLIKFEYQMANFKDMKLENQGIFGVGIDHIFSPTASAGVFSLIFKLIYIKIGCFVGTNPKLVLSGVKLLNNKT